MKRLAVFAMLAIAIIPLRAFSQINETMLSSDMRHILHGLGIAKCGIKYEVMTEEEALKHARGEIEKASKYAQQILLARTSQEELSIAINREIARVGGCHELFRSLGLQYLLP